MAGREPRKRMYQLKTRTLTSNHANFGLDANVDASNHHLHELARDGGEWEIDIYASVLIYCEELKLKGHYSITST